MAAARCDIDHIVPFDHTNPHAGGWTIRENLHPVCTHHHHAKTLGIWRCATLDNDAIYWHTPTGLRHITPPAYGTILVPDKYRHTRRPHHPHTTFGRHLDDHRIVDPEKPTPPAPAGEIFDHPTELYEPTWWEQNINDIPTDGTWDPHAPTLAHIAHLTDPQARTDAIELRARYIEHRAIAAARDKRRPPPF